MIKQTITALGMVIALSTNAFAEVTPKFESVIHSKNVTLSDVFDGITHNKSYVLAPAPKSGESLVLNTNDLMRISRAFKLNWYPSNQMDQVVIKTSENLISRQDIESLVKAEIKKLDKMSDKSFALKLKDRNIEIFVQGEESPNLNVKDLTIDFGKSTFRAKVTASTSDNNIEKIVSGNIKYLISVPVLSRRIDKGDIIDEYDLTFLELSSHQIGSNVITNKSNLIGMSPRNSIDPMQQVKRTDVHPPIIVQKGDIITMILSKGGMSLTAQGKALNKGAYGDLIKVKNTSSSIIIDGIITAPKKVSVDVLNGLL